MTMKPRLKVVSAEDVLSCLYYLHVNTPQDAALLDTESDPPLPAAAGRPFQPLIPRKPLNDTATLPPAAPDTTPNKRNALASPRIPCRESVLAEPHLLADRDWRPPMPPRPPSPQKLTSARQPLGPRALPPLPQAEQRSLPGSENIRPITWNRSPIMELPAPTKQPFEVRSPLSASTNTGLRHSTQPPHGPARAPVTITLIRRDPLMGAQWNIGEISCESRMADPKPSSGGLSSQVSVHLTTPGYSQFRSDSPPDLAGQGTFHREVRMDWSHKPIKQHLRRPSDPASSQPPYDGFLSPWSGRCEFSTGNGRTLKCKHILPSPTAAGSGIKESVSELRFNLPSTAYSGSSSPSKLTMPGSRPKSYHSRSNSSLDVPDSPDEDEDDEGEDIEPDPLSLGREKAGGGIRGKRVKLGKLIVHDEGLKMLDLVVAANMGVWWTIWDR